MSLVIILACALLLLSSCHANGPRTPPPRPPTEAPSTSAGCALIVEDDLPPLIAETFRNADNSAEPSISVEKMHILCTAQGTVKERYRSVSVLVNYTCSGNSGCANSANISQFDFSCDDDNGWEALVLSASTDGVRTDDPQSDFLTSVKTGCSYCATQEAIDAVGLNSSSDVLTHCVGECYSLHLFISFKYVFTACDPSCEEGLGSCISESQDACCNYYNHTTNSCIAECPTDQEHYSIEDDFTCGCQSGYTGGLCSENIDECTDQNEPPPCENGGTCVDIEGSFNCSCPEGFYGQVCDRKHGDICEMNPCSNGGTCIEMEQDSYMCQCPSGFMGSDCEEEDLCAFQPCLNNGTCSNNNTDSGPDFVCDCSEGWEGKTCEDCLRKNCKTCSGIPATCSECQEAFELDNGSCGQVSKTTHQNF